MRYRHHVVAAVAVVLALATCGATAGSAAASPKLLQLSIANGEVLTTPQGVVIFTYQPQVTFSGAGSTIKCSSFDQTGIVGELETNVEKKDTITLTGADGLYEGLHSALDESGCGPDWEGVKLSGFPWTLSLGANGKAKVTGHAVFSFEDGCSYELKKIQATMSIGVSVPLQFAGKAKRMSGSPPTCEKSFFVTEVGGVLESSPIYTFIHATVV